MSSQSGKRSMSSMDRLKTLENLEKLIATSVQNAGMSVNVLVFFKFLYLSLFDAWAISSVPKLSVR